MTEPKKRRFHLMIALAVLIGAIVLLIAAESGSIVPQDQEDEEPTSGAAEVPSGDRPAAAAVEVDNGATAVRAFGAAALIPPARGAERSPLADDLNDIGRTVDEDLVVVAELFANYRDVFHELPVGTNAEITAALAGDNMHGHAPLPSNHPAINPAGELTDRWGTPFFFHQLSATEVEIRSAGPDRRMHSNDDAVWPQSATPVITVAVPAGQPR